MADVIKKATNKFTKGLIMDFSPENTQNEVLTHALNATLLTFNGNELSLQNDMGNARVETAFLPEGYMPVGTCEYGGIIYIVSYNPLEDKSQIGCFPSPERNISNDELGINDAILDRTHFQHFNGNNPTGDLVNSTHQVQLKQDSLNPGDKFIIQADESIYNENLADLFVWDSSRNEYKTKEHPVIALNVVSIEDSGKIIYLNSDIRSYVKNNYKYHILGEGTQDSEGGYDQTEIDIDSYRDVLSSGYSVFKSKTSGKLAILAELIMIDSYSVTHSVQPKKDEQDNIIEGNFDIIIHTEVTPTLNSDNYLTEPKLRFYYLQNSQGFLQTFDTNGIENREPLFMVNEDGNVTKTVNPNFLSKELSKIFEDLTDNKTLNLNQSLEATGEFNFPKNDTYHGNTSIYNGKLEDLTEDAQRNIYMHFEANTYHRLKKSQILEYNTDNINETLDYYVNTLGAKFYFFEPSDEHDANYIYIENFESFSDADVQLFIKTKQDAYVSYSRFKPDIQYNYILGNPKPTGINEPTDGYPEEKPISLHVASDFIPQEDDTKPNYLQYDDVKLANIKLPQVVVDEGLDLPFKYDYTLIPCMNYGKLPHLAVSNSVDFSKLHAFNKSNFNVWKYHIDGNQLRLTFGAEIYDTYETDKVDALIVEFYDLWGFAGSLEITNKKSYSGSFTKVITLNTLNALDRRMVFGDTQVTSFKRNVNIREMCDENGNVVENTFWYNNKTNVLTEPNALTGWSGIPDQDNDCGTLYSNIMYGVKTYLRRTKNKGSNDEQLEFIKKNEFFLYTFPILNEYYYIVDNYNSIQNPKLDLYLTYKLLDQSNRLIYAEDPILQGYKEEDREEIEAYLSGFSKKTNLNVTKYFKYKGTSTLYLEIGLKKEYEDYNLSYDPRINQHFTCNLRVVGDDGDGNTFSVASDDNSLTDYQQILNYVRGADPSIEPEGIKLNKLGFDSTFKDHITVSGNDFYNANFINHPGTSPITIEYEFVVGYNAYISNIRPTQIPATTICALFHKQPDETYNYEDFGIYEQDNDNDESGPTFKFSNTMYYNGQQNSEGVFGICRQISKDGTMAEQCQGVDSINYTIKDNLPGKLNTGEPLKEMLKYIGKLTFCTPHAHALIKDAKTNILAEQNEDKNWEWYLDSKSSAYDHLYNHPCYNLVLNTKNTIKYQSEFISTMQHQGSNANSTRRFIGFEGRDLETFNSRLLKTMSEVYAYNPDYDQLNVNVGDVSFQTWSPKFTSNIISINSKLDSINLNQYVCIGSFPISRYLTYLNKHSKTTTTNGIQIMQDFNNYLPQVQFIPNYTYCGTVNQAYLISPLQYNTPLPEEMKSELTFTAVDSLVVKLTDGTNRMVQGTYNPKTLYGYNQQYNKLVQLDVSNYEIAQDGSLILNNKKIATERFEQSVTLTPYLCKTCVENQPKIHTTTIDCELGTPFTFDIYISFAMTNWQEKQAILLAYNENGAILGRRRKVGSDGVRTFAYFKYPAPSNRSVFSEKIVYQMECKAKVLKPVLNDNGDDMSIYMEGENYNSAFDCNLSDLTYDQLYSLITKPNGYTTFSNNSKFKNSDLWSSTKDSDNYVGTDKNNMSSDPFLVQVGQKIYIKAGASDGIELYHIKISKVNFSLCATHDISTTTVNVLPTIRTTDYGQFSIYSWSLQFGYTNSAFKGTSITLNDLTYEPNKEGHRLFVRNNNYRYIQREDSKMYYEGSDKNCTYLFTGPCATSIGQ